MNRPAAMNRHDTTACAASSPRGDSPQVTYGAGTIIDVRNAMPIAAVRYFVRIAGSAGISAAPNITGARNSPCFSGYSYS